MPLPTATPQQRYESLVREIAHLIEHFQSELERWETPDPLLQQWKQEEIRDRLTLLKALIEHAQRTIPANPLKFSP